jgi:hypothetical protein
MPHSALPPQPPQPPGQRARLRLSAAQYVGVPLMALVPVLALAGVFGERRELRQDVHGGLLLSARVPTRFRYRQRMTLEVSVTNRGSDSLGDVRVRLDSTYLDRFSSVALSPHASPDGVVRFGALGPQQTDRLTVTLEGERAGALRGVAVATDAAGDTARVTLASTVFP